MDTLAIFKTGAPAVLLLGVFSLPALTATQLVQVLGESIASVNDPVQVSLTDRETFVTKNGGSFVVSYTKPGVHPVLRIVNRSGVEMNLTLQVSAARVGVKSQTVDLMGSFGSLRLFDHALTSTQPSYQLTVAAGRTLDLAILVVSDRVDEGYGTITFQVK